MTEVLKTKQAAVSSWTAGQEFRRPRDVLECVTKICTRHFAPNRTIVLSSSSTVRQFPGFVSSLQMNDDSKYSADFETRLLEDLHIVGRWSIVVSQPRKNTNKSALEKYRNYIVVARSQDGKLLGFKEQIFHLESSEGWNTRAKFIVVLETHGRLVSVRETAVIALQELWQRKVMNAVVLVEQNETVNIYTWFPYPHPRDEFLDVCVTQTDRDWFPRKRNLFPGKIPRDMQGYMFRVSAPNLPPFVMIEGGNRTSNLYEVDGLEVRLLRCVSQKMNLSNIVIHYDGDYPYGKEIENGTWDGITGDLASNRSDVAIGGWFGYVIREEPLDSSVHYFTDQFPIFVPLAEKFPSWLSFSRVFGKFTWLCLLISIPLTGILFRYVATHQADESRRYGSFLNCVSYAWCVVLGVSVVEMPRSSPLRVLFIAWLIYSLAINTLFQTYVTVFIMNPGVEHQIDSYEELGESELEFAFEEFYNSFLSEETLKTLKPRYVCEGPHSCFLYAISNHGKALLTSRVFALSEADTLGYARNFPLHSFTEDMFQLYIVMVFREGYPLLESFNTIITRLVEAGLSNKFLEDVMDMLRSKNDSLAFDTSFDYTPMSASHLHSPFVLLFLGFASSFVIFLGELIIHRARLLTITSNA